MQRAVWCEYMELAVVRERFLGEKRDNRELNEQAIKRAQNNGQNSNRLNVICRSFYSY